MKRSPEYVSDMLERLAIREQIDRYTMFLNTRDWTNFARLLAEDFSFTCSAPVGTRYASRAEILAHLRGGDATHNGFLFQMPHGIVVDSVAGDQARARHTLHVKSDRFEILAIYYDGLVLEADGVWRFARRDLRITYHDKAPAPGALYRTFPDPGAPDWYFA